MTPLALALLLAWPDPDGLRTIYAEDYRGNWLDETVMRATDPEVARSTRGDADGIRKRAGLADDVPIAAESAIELRLGRYALERRVVTATLQFGRHRFGSALTDEQDAQRVWH